MIFVPIRTNTLKPDISLNFEVYLRIQDRYVLYVRQGDELLRQRHDNLKKNKVAQVYIPAGQEKEYQDFLDAYFDEAVSSNLPIDQRVDVIYGFNLQAAEEVFKKPESLESFNKVKRATKAISSLIIQNNKIVKNITSPHEGESKWELLIRHSVNTSVLSVAFAKALNFPESQLELFSIAGIFHDIGLTKLPPRSLELLFIADDKFSPDDLSLYKKHPAMGSSILQGKKHISNEMLTLMLRHEERVSGSGYPSGLKESNISEEAFALSCHYSRSVTCLRHTYSEAAKNIFEGVSGNFSTGVIQKFKELLKKEGLL